MECNFTVGQQVVCITTQFLGYSLRRNCSHIFEFKHLIKVGEIYTVRAIEAPRHPANAPKILLNEIVTRHEKGFPSACFRPLITLDMLSEEVKELENV